jgi:hypothetical protein
VALHHRGLCRMDVSEVRARLALVLAQIYVRILSERELSASSKPLPSTPGV